MRKFIEVKNGKSTGTIVSEGGLYNGKRFGKKSENQVYIDAGLYPLTDTEKPTYNYETETLSIVDTVGTDEVTRTYTVEKIVTTKEQKYARLERIFNDKTTGLKKIAIDKPFMENAEAINNQYRIYEEMYKNAKAGRYDTATNDEIILANETAKESLAQLTLLLNSVRAVLEEKIATESIDADEMLDIADGITLTKEELTPTKLGEIMSVFGLA